MTLYDMSKIEFSNYPDMTKKELLKAENKVQEFIEANPAIYYALINNEVRSFTVFVCRTGTPKDLAHEVIDVIGTFGGTKAIEKGNGMIEFWSKADDNPAIMYAFFPYDQGVIEI